MACARFTAIVLLTIFLCASTHASESQSRDGEVPPTAVISAAPTSGRAPLAVLLDASGSSANAVSYEWHFGDGGASTAQSITHIYNVAGTYEATLIVANDAGVTDTASITITVTGTGEGPVSDNVNFRWAITSSNFK